MASIAGVRLPDPSALKGKPIAKRIAVLTKYARKIHQKSSGGSEESLTKLCLEVVQHFKPAFGSLKLLRSQPDADGHRDFKLAVDNYCCHRCKFEFDEKDFKGICAEGVMCPKCGELVVKKEGSDVH